MTIDARNVAATIVAAGGTQSEATEIATKLDKWGSVSEWLHPDGRVNLASSVSDQEYVCKAVRDVIHSSQTAAVQSAVLRLLDPRQQPVVGQGPPVLIRVDEDQQELVQQADAMSDLMVIMGELSLISKNLPIDPTLAAQMQRIVGQVESQIKEVGADNFMKFPITKEPQGFQGGNKAHIARLKSAVTLLRGCGIRIMREGPTEVILQNLKIATKALEDFSRFRDGALRLANFAQKPQAATSARVVAIAVQQVATQMSQRASAAPNPAVRSALLATAAAIGAVGLGMGLYAYFSGSKAEAAPVPMTGRLNAETPSDETRSQPRIEWGTPVDQLELVGVSPESLPLAQPLKQRPRLPVRR